MLVSGVGSNFEDNRGNEYREKPGTRLGETSPASRSQVTTQLQLGMLWDARFLERSLLSEQGRLDLKTGEGSAYGGELFSRFQSFHKYT